MTASCLEERLGRVAPINSDLQFLDQRQLVEADRDRVLPARSSHPGSLEIATISVIRHLDRTRNLVLPGADAMQPVVAHPRSALCSSLRDLRHGRPPGAHPHQHVRGKLAGSREDHHPQPESSLRVPVRNGQPSSRETNNLFPCTFLRVLQQGPHRRRPIPLPTTIPFRLPRCWRSAASHFFFGNSDPVHSGA